MLLSLCKNAGSLFDNAPIFRQHIGLTSQPANAISVICGFHDNAVFVYVPAGSKWKKIIAELSAGSIVFIRWLAGLFLFLFLLCGSFFGKILFLRQPDHHCTADAVAIYMYVYYLYRCRDKYLLLYAFPAYEKKDKKKEA